MKIRTIATIGAAVMGLSLISAPAFAHDGDRGRGDYGRGSYSRHDDCNDRGHRHHARYDRDDGRRFSFRFGEGRWDRNGRGDHHNWNGHGRSQGWGHGRDHDGDRRGRDHDRRD